MRNSDTTDGPKSGLHRETTVVPGSDYLMPEDEVFFPKKKWGSQFFGFEPSASALAGGSAPHLDGRAFHTPEGEVFVLNCAACGGQREFLLDFRLVQRQAKQQSRLGLSPEATEDAYIERGLEEFDDQALAFVNRHSGCSESPIEHRLPTTAQRRIGDVLTATRKQLEQGFLRAKLYLIGRGGELAIIPYHIIPDGPGHEAWEKNAALEHLKQAIRDWMSETDFPLEATLFVSAVNVHLPENGVPTSDTFAGATEGVAVILGTEKFSKAGFAPLKDDPTDPSTNFSLDDLELFSTSHARPTDGLFSELLLEE